MTYDEMEVLDSWDDLPDPNSVIKTEAFLVKGFIDGKHLAIIKGNPPKWYDNGLFITSSYGEMIAAMYDEKNNFMNPPSDTGWFIYNLYGKSFDDISDMVGQMVLNLNPIRCDDSYFDMLARELQIKRDPNWSNDEYRAVIILNTYNTMTVKGLEYVLDMIALTETSESDGYITVSYTGVGFRASEEDKEYELSSEEDEEYDLLADVTTELMQIKIPPGVNRDLIMFIKDYLPYKVTVSMIIDYERLRSAIENSSEVELNIEELLSSAVIYREEYIKVKNKDLFMLFNSDYELVECAGNVITIKSETNECEEL
jgi:hypothetical protein